MAVPGTSGFNNEINYVEMFALSSQLTVINGTELPGQVCGGGKAASRWPLPSGELTQSEGPL